MPCRKGFVDAVRLGGYFTNLNDGATDGIRHRSKPFIGLNFAPEVCVGLTENVTPLDEFIGKL